MDQSTADGIASFGLIGAIFFIILAILWVLVPFAIFGIKPKLSALLKEQQRTNELLTAIGIEAREARGKTWQDSGLKNLE